MVCNAAYMACAAEISLIYTQGIGRFDPGSPARVLFVLLAEALDWILRHFLAPDLFYFLRIYTFRQEGYVYTSFGRLC